MQNNHIAETIQRYKQDTESVYHTWFINNEDRLKVFRSIRRGVSQVVKDIPIWLCLLPKLRLICFW